MIQVTRVLHRARIEPVAFEFVGLCSTPELNPLTRLALLNTLLEPHDEETGSCQGRSPHNKMTDKDQPRILHDVNREVFNSLAPDDLHSVHSHLCGSLIAIEAESHVGGKNVASCGAIVCSPRHCASIFGGKLCKRFHF